MRPAEVAVADHWSLAARPGEFAEAAAVWRGVLARHEPHLRSWSGQARAVCGDWSGETARTYTAHRTALEHDVWVCVRLAARVAGALQACADAVAAARRQLALHFGLVQEAVQVRAAGDGSVRFRPRSPSDMDTIWVAVAQALRLRASLSRALTAQAAVIAATLPEWERVAGDWRHAAAGEETFAAPAEAAGTQVIRAGGTVVISTGAGDDQVRIHLDPATGEQVVVSGGGVWRFPGEARVVVRTGEGDDTVTVAPGTQVRLALLGGEGADELHGGDQADLLLGLAGNDYLSGGRGDDQLSGGPGNDAVYGLPGDDRLSGGEGRDFLDGGGGRDEVSGDGGDDVVSGGSGDDRLTGGDGDDVLYPGRGADGADGGRGADTAYAPGTAHLAGVEREVTVEIADLGTEIRVEGSAEFAERVRADLDLLRASPAGRPMLAALDAGLTGQDTLTIRESGEPNAAAWPDVSAAAGSQRAIDYNPAYSTFLDDTPPVVVLYHEMAHQYDFVNGTALPGQHDDPQQPDRIPLGDGRWIGVPKAERQAVGLPVDDDGDPATPLRIDPRHPFVFTENGLRAELTWRPRTKYGE